jgi:hypothetical protein
MVALLLLLVPLGSLVPLLVLPLQVLLLLLLPAALPGPC